MSLAAFFDWRKRCRFAANGISTLIANCRFFGRVVSHWSRNKLCSRMRCLGCSFPFYKAWLLWYVSFVLVCRLRLDTIGPACSDLLETPRHARPRVCVQSFIQLPLKDCHAFTSLLVSLLLLRCRRQSSVWSERLSAGGLLVCTVGGWRRSCEHGNSNDLMCAPHSLATLKSEHCKLSAKLCFCPFVWVQPKEVKMMLWQKWR